MWLLVALASADECTLTARVDEQGQLEFVDRGDCPPWFQIQLENSVGQDAPLPLPEHTLVHLPVSIEGRAAFVGPVTEGRVVGVVERPGPDLSHLAERVPALPGDCSLLASVDAEGRVDAVSPVDCAIEDYETARRKASRARFAETATGGHATLPVSDAVVSLGSAARP